MVPGGDGRSLNETLSMSTPIELSHDEAYPFSMKCLLTLVILLGFISPVHAGITEVKGIWCPTVPNLFCEGYWLENGQADCYYIYGFKVELGESTYYGSELKKIFVYGAEIDIERLTLTDTLESSYGDTYPCYLVQSRQELVQKLEDELFFKLFIHI